MAGLMGMAMMRNRSMGGRQTTQRAGLAPSGSEPPAIGGYPHEPDAGGLSGPYDTGIQPWTGGGNPQPSRETGGAPREPTGSMSHGGYSFGPFANYATGVWNPLMPLGSQNMYGGTYRGIEHGPNQGGGFGYHTVFTPGGVSRFGGMARIGGGMPSYGNISGTGRLPFNRVLPNGTVMSTGAGGGGLGNPPVNMQGQHLV